MRPTAMLSLTLFPSLSKNQINFFCIFSNDSGNTISSNRNLLVNLTRKCQINHNARFYSSNWKLKDDLASNLIQSWKVFVHVFGAQTVCPLLIWKIIRLLLWLGPTVCFWRLSFDPFVGLERLITPDILGLLHSWPYLWQRLLLRRLWWSHP